MIKRLLLPIALFFVAHSSHAQFDTTFAKSHLRICADSFAIAFKAKDWDKYMKYMNPAMIGSIGGTTEFRNYVEKMFAPIPAKAWKKYEPGKILQILKTDSELQAVIELKTLLELDGQRVSGTSSLVAQSWDGGFFWTFFDPQGNIKIARTIKPDLSEQIVIPQDKEKIEAVKN